LVNTSFADLLVAKSRQFHLNDKSCPLAYEPSGEDFLSPCISEADLMRRVLPANEFAAGSQPFFRRFPLPATGLAATSRFSRSQHPKLAHLDGLNLSRAWCCKA